MINKLLYWACKKSDRLRRIAAEVDSEFRAKYIEEQTQIASKHIDFDDYIVDENIWSTYWS